MFLPIHYKNTKNWRYPCPTPLITGTDATFDAEVLKSDLPVLVDFWAPWCGPCRIIAPVVDEIAETHKGKLKVVKMNVDENGQAPQTYGVMAIPTLILFKGGQLKEKIVGSSQGQADRAHRQAYLTGRGSLRYLPGSAPPDRFGDMSPGTCPRS